MNNNEKVIEASGIKKTFNEGREHVEVLHGIDLYLHAGEVVALEGRSGSGKTTLLSILGCILTATAGELVVAGERISDKSDLSDVRRRLLGFVFQQFNLFPPLTALENVEYALNLRGWRGRKAREEAERIIIAVGLESRMQFLPQDLSGGQKQRVAIARALAGRPPLALADEPTANLDRVSGNQVLAMFRELAEQENCALLIVTHDARVRTIVDRVLHLEDGRIIH
jgi:putative ABC transport system ATP-binding protein